MMDFVPSILLTRPIYISSQTPSTSKGELHLSLHLSTSTESRRDNFIEHQRLLRVLLAHELGASPRGKAWREADFSEEALHILAQHAVQARLTRDETALARYARTSLIIIVGVPVGIYWHCVYIDCSIIPYLR